MWKLPLASPVASISSSNSATSAAGKAMAELGVAACIGAGCVQQELLTKPMVASLSKTTFSIFLPLFLGTSILKTVVKYGFSRSSLAGPLMGVLQPFFLYHITNSILMPLLKIDSDSEDGRCTAVCSAFGNTSVVPLIFVESLFRNNPEYLSRSYANISLFLVGWSPFFWSFGRSVLFPGIQSLENEADKKSASSTFSIRQFLSDTRKLFSPPVIGVSIGLLIATSPFLLSLCMENDKSNGVPLQAIFTTCETFGKAASPLSLLVLTSSLALGIGISPSRGDEKKDKLITKKRPPLLSSSFLRQWICVSLARFIVSPILVLTLLHSFHGVGVIPHFEQDPVLWFVSVLQGCMPSAQNLVLMLQVANKEDKAGAIAKFLFFVYATSMIPVVFIVSATLRRFGLA